MKLANSLYSFLSKNSFLLPLCVIGVTLILLLLTLSPSTFFGESKIWDYDKLGHTVLFCSWCLSVGLYYRISRSSPVGPWIILASGISFGLLIEILQYILPVNRNADPLDVLFDAIGCLLAVWILKVMQPNGEKQSAQTPPA